MELKIGTSCGSCIHTNTPKTPRDHAAHYEVAKTERWCFKHDCHVTRETTCEDHEGVNRAAKTAFTRIKNYNVRAQEVREVVKLMGDRRVTTKHYEFYVENGWIKYHSIGYAGYVRALRSKDASTERYLKEIREMINASESN